VVWTYGSVRLVGAEYPIEYTYPLAPHKPDCGRGK